jgi:hypothetical protein
MLLYVHIMSCWRGVVVVAWWCGGGGVAVWWWWWCGVLKLRGNTFFGEETFCKVLEMDDDL